MPARKLPARKPPARKLPRRLLAVLAGLLLMLGLSGVPARAATPTTGEIVGQILDGGRPVPGTKVDIPHGYGSPIVTAVLTDATGRFRLTGVPVGSWHVQFTLPGGGLVQYYGDVADILTATQVTVTAGRAARIVAHVLPHGGIYGRIVSNRGRPVAGAIVGVEVSRFPISTTTDANGYYALNYLTARDYWVYAQRAPTAPRQYWPRKETLFAGTGVTVTNGTRQRVDERLLPVGAITGTYLTPNGPILATVEANADRNTSTMTSLEDGSYALWLRPGDYTLFFDTGGAMDQWAPAVLDEADAKVFTVHEDEIIRHDEPSVPYGTVSGRVVDYAGQPFPVPVTITFYGEDGNSWPWTTTADSTGHWSLGVFPGTYKIEYYYLNGLTQWANGKTTIDAADPIEVGSATTITLPNEQFRPNTLVVVGATLDGEQVSTFCAALHTPANVRTCTESGEAYFDTVAPGTYQVTVEIPDHAPATGSVTLANDSTAAVTVPVTG